MAVTVQDSEGTPQESVHVYAFDEPTFIGIHSITDGIGIAGLGVTDGDYRFRADYDGVAFWSGAVNHCAIPGCISA